MKRLRQALLWVSAGLLAASGCSAGASSSGFGNDNAVAVNGSTSSSTGNAGAIGGGSSASSTSTLPPETKVESAFRSPVATGQVVWIANPTSGRVAYIDAT